MADTNSRDDDLPFEEFCFRYGLHKRRAPKILDVIQDVGAFRIALSTLNPSRKREISMDFFRLLVRRKLLLSAISVPGLDKKASKSSRANPGSTEITEANPDDLSDVSGINPAFSKISKKTLFDRANRVSKTAEKLMKEIESLLELAIPASLKLPAVNSVTDKLRNELFVFLPQKSEDIKTIVEIANSCIVKFQKIGTARDINPIDPPDEAFNRSLGILWEKAGHKVKTTVESDFDAFRNWSYQALGKRQNDSAGTSRSSRGGFVDPTLEKEHSSSATSRSQGLDSARKFRQEPEGPARQEKLAESFRHAVTMNKKLRHRPQLAPIKMGDIKDDGEDLRKDIEKEIEEGRKNLRKAELEAEKKQKNKKKSNNS